jgi:hypothetical protein
MVNRASLMLLLAITACSFDRRSLDERWCEEPDDCEPNEDCTNKVCIQRACQTAAECGGAYAYTCPSGGCLVKDCELDTDCGAGLTCPIGYCALPFNIQSAASTSNTSLSVTFDSPPEPSAATSLASYAVSGLALTGTPMLSGASTVTLSTASQMSGKTYTLTVSGVTRAEDYASLATATAMFTGI